MTRTETDLERRAREAFDAVQTHFWDESSETYRHVFPFTPREGPFHYWWQAHALDTLVDAHERDGDAAHLERARSLLAGIQEENAGQIVNDYYDDMLWLALACLRVHGAGGGVRFLEAARTLWADIQGGWNEQQGGGIAWRKTQLNYKNTPANAPAVILAARLYALDGDPADLARARRILAWLDGHLMEPESGWAWDGLNRLGDGQVDRDWRFSYNQGVVIGARLALHAVTGEAAQLEGARRTARTALARLAPDGLLQGAGDGDGGLFDGVFVRYLTELALHEHDPQLLDFLHWQGHSAWAHRDRTTGLSGPDWGARPAAPFSLSPALSGLMLHEALATLERAGRAFTAS